PAIRRLASTELSPRRGRNLGFRLTWRVPPAAAPQPRKSAQKQGSDQASVQASPATAGMAPPAPRPFMPGAAAAIGLPPKQPYSPGRRAAFLLARREFVRQQNGRAAVTLRRSHRRCAVKA